MLASMNVVSADTTTINYDSTVNDNPTTIQEVDVDVEKAEIYAVTLPKSITLAGDTDSPTYEYTVKVQGEISTNNYVRVIPMDGSYVETDMGYTHDLTVEQEKRKWTYDEVLAGSNTTGTMTAIDLNPGKYTGKVKFFISLDDGYFYESPTCTTGKLRVGEDANDNGTLEDSEKFVTPVAVSKPLGHTYDGEHQFSYECTRCHTTVYEVSTPEELMTFTMMAASGNSFTDIEIDLIADIDMYEFTNNTTFQPIGMLHAPFAGTFDGNNHSISGLKKQAVYCKNTDFIYSGLFGTVKNATIKNLVLENSNIAMDTLTATGMGYTFNYGAIVGHVAGDVTLENCRVHNINTTVNFAYNSNGMGNKYSYSSPFIGLVTGDAVNIVIRNCCATNNEFITDASNYNLGVACYLTRFGTYNETATLTVDSAYVVDNLISYISTETGNTVNDVTNYLGSDVTTTYTNVPYAVTGTNCTALTDDELKSQTGVDLLNTDRDPIVWQLDLLNVNGGYPVQVA